MRTPGEHLISVNQFSVPCLALAELADTARAQGAEGVGVLRGVLDELGPAEVGRTLGERGLRPTSVCVALGLVGTTTDERTARRRDAETALASACELGAPLVVVPGGPRRGLPLPHARQQFVEAFSDLAETAQRWGGRVLVEPLGAASVHLSCVTTLAAAVETTAPLPAAGVVLDVWHVWTDPDLETTLARGADQIEIVHLADWPAEPRLLFERCLPQDGIIDLVALTRALLSTGYAGWWELEVPVAALAVPVAEHQVIDTGLARTRATLANASDQLTEVDACAS